jgi:hypothetical protein
MFAVPPALLLLWPTCHLAWPAPVLGVLAWATAAAVYLPTLRLYELPALWAATLPLAGLLYGAMTVDSALRHARGARRVW